jgi:hypothetical protein
MDKSRVIEVINNTAAANVKLFTIASTAPDLSRMAVGKDIARLTGPNAKGEVTVIVISR